MTMNRYIFFQSLTGFFLFSLLLVSGCYCLPPETKNEISYKIGIYDSRAVAIGFVGSELYQSTDGLELSKMMEEYKAAEAEGNTKLMSELENKGQAQQDVLHQQGFGTAPVDNILQHIENQIPALLEEADVSFLISKWNQEALEKHSGAERIDMTMLLVDAFEPNDKQRKSALEIQKQDPIPSSEIHNHQD